MRFRISPIFRRVAKSRRRGAIFVTALWITIILVSLVLVMCRSMRVESSASGNRASNAQVDAMEKGVEQYVLEQVDGCHGDALTVTQAPAEGMPLGSGYFWILRPWPDTDQQYGFGITDEASKINLNVATSIQLQMLPNVTPAIGDAIVDWYDTNDTAGQNGAESDYYQSLQPFPYNAKNADFETVEELMLVRDIDKNVLFGQDLNRDGVISQSEANQPTSLNQMNTSVNTDTRGLFNFVTAVTIEPNTAGDGTARINVNTAQPTQLRKVLETYLPSTGDKYWANLQSRYQSAVPPVNTKGGKAKASAVTSSGGKTSTGTTPTATATPQFTNLGDFYSTAKMTPQDFDAIADYLTTKADKTLKGNLNINTASQQAMMALPGLQQSDAQALVAQRQSGGNGSSFAWIYKALTPGKANAISGSITTRSFQYSADIVAVSGDGRTFKRVRIIVDGQASPAKIIYRRDLTSYGWPLDPAIRDQLKQGKYVSPNVSSEPAQGTLNTGLN